MAATPLKTLDGSVASRLAIGGGPETTQLEPGLLHEAREAGVNFFYWSSGAKSPAFARDFKEIATSPSRDAIFIAANARTSPEFVRADVMNSLSELGIESLDAVVVQYILPEEEPSKVEAALKAAQELKAEGLVRHVAASTHSFDIAVRLSSSGLLDAIMLRYNMAHRTVERDAFPTALEYGVPVFSFTSTRWNTLQGGHRLWKGPLPSTGDCIGFALSHPAVAHNISSIRTLEELRLSIRRLAEIEAMSDEEYSPMLARWRKYGELVHDDQDNLLEADDIEAIRETYASGSDQKHMWTFDNMGTEEDPTRGANQVRGEAHGEQLAETDDSNTKGKL